MSDELLPYYNSELAFIRNMGAKFAAAYPKIAGRLQLSAEVTDDPHVARLIESFAYLNARIRHKLDDDFPELTDALLGVIYPHYQRPIPSMSVVELIPDREQGELTTGYHVREGVSIESDTVQGEACRFKTCYPVTLWPLRVRSAKLLRPPFPAPKSALASQAAAVIHIVLEATSKEAKLSQLGLDQLRFFLRGADQHVYPLYELLFNHVTGLALAASPEDRNAVLLGPETIRPVGFDRDQGMLPFPSRSFLGYRILTEFFAFPQKYLFLDLTKLTARNLPGDATRLEIFLFLDKLLPELEQQVSVETFRLGCTPIVNLYAQRAEPISLTQTKSEYRVVADARRPFAHEVYSIDKVTATSPSGAEVEYHPFYSFQHAHHDARPRNFWHASRRPAESQSDTMDMYLSLVDLDFNPAQAADWTIDLETTCFNRNLPNSLPFGSGQPRLRLTQGGPISQVQCLVRPTAVLRPAVRRGALWKLISHLSLNHLSISGGDAGADALREILHLYDYRGASSILAGIERIQSRRMVGPVATSAPAGPFCRGTEVTLDLDEAKFVGSGLFLFATVMERFLGLYCSINSFTKLVLRTRQRGEVRRWPPRAGEKVLL
jgi:type VI secretion system protein ImpG